MVVVNKKTNTDKDLSSLNEKVKAVYTEKKELLEDNKRLSDMVLL